MRAGQLKYKLRLLRPTTTTNDFGEENITYEEFRTIWAERAKYSGRNSEELAEHFADASVNWIIRDAHPVQEHWRVEQLGGYLYTVEAVEPNLNKGMKTLICSRINP